VPKAIAQIHTSIMQRQPFNFEVATIELIETELIIKRSQKQAWEFTEDLGNGIQLEMVAIPEGGFLMGSPETEEGHRDSESPQHQVTLKPFFMGKYPIIQAQWQVVAALPQVNRELDPDPSYFKGANRPVETVSWYDAVEFCDRLSQKTGKEYCLPSEAQWEYACRAGTETPFHFGETITTDLGNYNGNYVYGSGVKGKSPKGTTPVGSFGVANNFGLYDMHSNVWEWCADHWHENYEGAPTDGSSWEELDENDNRSRLLRGGCWFGLPVYCRSAYRNLYDPGEWPLNLIGFRVICGAAWTL
jgi:formylglycine-generating enzyme required for sulfatase activity